MTKYTIEIHHVEGNWFEPTTTIHNLSYIKLLELYALITALKFSTIKILLYLKNDNKSKVTIEDFIVSAAASRLIEEL